MFYKTLAHSDVFQQNHKAQHFSYYLFNVCACECMCLCVIQYAFTPLPVLLSSSVSQRTEKGERLQCLKWAVSQSPWSFPSCRNLIINNRWHIIDKGCKCVLCVCVRVCVYT